MPTLPAALVHGPPAKESGRGLHSLPILRKEATLGFGSSGPVVHSGKVSRPIRSEAVRAFAGSLSDLQILRNVLGEPLAKLGHTCAEVDDAA